MKSLYESILDDEDILVGKSIKDSQNPFILIYKLFEGENNWKDASFKYHAKIEKIIKDEKIVATQEDIDEMIKEQAKNMNKEFEEYKKTMNERQLGYFENSATIEKLFKYLRENNKID